MYRRILSLPKKSFFLFGPRGTGKSTWLSQVLKEAALNIDLLKSSQFLKYKRDPSTLQKEVLSLKKGDWIIIDEIQKLPELLDEIHSILFETKHKYLFALSGSSARKLKRSHANMLAGRALSKKMFPLSYSELGQEPPLKDLLRFGQLPMAVTAESEREKVEFLESYFENYLREEIQQEALVRNLDSFYRFLTVASLVNGQILNISNIARDVGVARSTVQGYFSILYDTLIGWSLPSLRKRTRVKEVQHPKFYLFDCGVQRVLAGELRESPSKAELGHLFETFVINELRAINSYHSLGGEFFYWRTESGTEVDLIWKRGKKYIGIEIKYSERWKESHNKGLATLLEKGTIRKAYGVYLGDTPLRFPRVDVLPFGEFLSRFPGLVGD